jgi:hypothetical protein
VVKPSKQPQKPASPADELEGLIERAREGDLSTLPEVRRVLRDPAQVDALGGDLALQAEMSFVHALAGDDLVLREALPLKMESLRTELAGPDPTPVERLLVERVVACWLQVQDADVRYAQRQGDITHEQGDYYQRRMDRAHKRYLSALRTLALVRKLGVPVLQVNVARRQVNVVGAVPSPLPGAGPDCAEPKD